MVSLIQQRVRKRREELQAGDEKKVNCSKSSHWLCLLQGCSDNERVISVAAEVQCRHLAGYSPEKEMGKKSRVGKMQSLRAGRMVTKWP